jgi:hypothetical protein
MLGRTAGLAGLSRPARWTETAPLTSGRAGVAATRRARTGRAGRHAVRVTVPVVRAGARVAELRLLLLIVELAVRIVRCTGRPRRLPLGRPLQFPRKSVLDVPLILTGMLIVVGTIVVARGLVAWIARLAWHAVATGRLPPRPVGPVIRPARSPRPRLRHSPTSPVR